MLGFLDKRMCSSKDWSHISLEELRSWKRAFYNASDGTTLSSYNEGSEM